MAKGKKSTSHAGPHKNHGPKRKMHHDYNSTLRLAFGKAGCLSKYEDYESWQLACQARGKRNATKEEFKAFFLLDKEAKDQYFNNINHK